MPKRKFTAEQIVTKLRPIEVLLAQGKTIAIACKEAGTTVPGRVDARERNA